MNRRKFRGTSNNGINFLSVADMRKNFCGNPLELLEQYVNSLDTYNSVVSKMFLDTNSLVFLQSASFS